MATGASHPGGENMPAGGPLRRRSRLPASANSPRLAEVYAGVNVRREGLVGIADRRERSCDWPRATPRIPRGAGPRDAAGPRDRRRDAAGECEPGEATPRFEAGGGHIDTSSFHRGRPLHGGSEDCNTPPTPSFGAPIEFAPSSAAAAEFDLPAGARSCVRVERRHAALALDRDDGQELFARPLACPWGHVITTTFRRPPRSTAIQPRRRSPHWRFELVEIDLGHSARDRDANRGFARVRFVQRAQGQRRSGEVVGVRAASARATSRSGTDADERRARPRVRAFGRVELTRVRSTPTTEFAAGRRLGSS
ncbi:hypothetical protein SAMN02745121_07601 [Nannocystis exedens]|uniref:Uncharacterized protein n=1 Tax=Nannocystis exedens TaxID=54 RepID=A0A1I2GZK1_9BACT|nr:hypothetical protein NAEX_01890 [Nannocystis exedens]SFF22489.1 hypothetical protein SAMN02745121_07601 [Nannocystis exedens]